MRSVDTSDMTTTTIKECSMRQTITTCTTCGYGHVETIRCPACDPRPHPRGGRMGWRTEVSRRNAMAIAAERERADWREALSTPDLGALADRMEALVKRTRADNERGALFEAAMASDLAGTADEIDVSIARR
jgi:hypothetical protein